jgi:hypothetical protein
MIRWLWSKTPWEKRRIKRLRDLHEAAMLRLKRELDLENERRLEQAKWLRVIRPSPVSNKSPVARSDAPQVRFESNPPSAPNPMLDAYSLNSITEYAPTTGHQRDSIDTSNSCSSSSSSSDSSSSSCDSSSSSSSSD